MLDIKYIKIEVEKFRCKQNSDGTWICSDLKANTVKELDHLIGEVNQVLNKYNRDNIKKTVKKDTKPPVKGLE